MTEPTSVPQPEPDLEEAFGLALDQVLAAWAEDRLVSPEELVGRFPQLSRRIEELFDLAHEIAVVRPPPQLPRVPGYELLGEAGRGGMGVVYRARQLGVDRLVALKVVLGGLDDERVRQRFLAEAKALGRVRHSNIVTIFEVIDLPGLCAYAMEWIEGRSLADLLEARLAAGAARTEPFVFAAAGGSVAVEPVTWTCRLGLDLCRALAAMHRNGLLHRDVKPGNVLLRRDGVPLLSDFGLVHDETYGLTGLTRTGQFLGTPAFAPPEQLRGEQAKIAATTDVYGLGATLHCACTGQPPFPGRTPVELLAAIEARRRVPLTAFGLSRDLETIVGKCLEADPRDRYADADALADELDRVLGQHPIRARRLGVVGRLWRFGRRNRRLVAASAIVGAGVLSACVVLGWFLFASWTSSGRQLNALREARQMLLEPAHTEQIILADRGIDPERPMAWASRFSAASVAYAAAVAIDPADLAVRAEADVVVLADLLDGNRKLKAAERQPLPEPGVLSVEAPGTWAAGVAWHREADAVPSVPEAAADRRLFGLLAFLLGKAALCHTAWESLELTGDPFIDAASGQMHLARGDSSKAYPRLKQAAEAWPKVGFLAVGLARCAIDAGDLVVAKAELERAAGLSYQDPFNTLRAVRADEHAAHGRWDEAKADYDWMLAHHRAIEVRVRYAAMLERLGDRKRACELLLQAAEMEPEAERVRYLPRAVALWCRHWEGLGAGGRIAAVEHEWQQGAFGVGVRMLKMLREELGTPRVEERARRLRQELLCAVAVGAPATQALDRAPGMRSLAVLPWLEDSVRSVGWLQPRWRRAMAAVVVAATSEQLVDAWRHDPPAVPIAKQQWPLFAVPLAKMLWKPFAVACSAVAVATLPQGSVRIEWRPLHKGRDTVSPSARALAGAAYDEASGWAVVQGGWSTDGEGLTLGDVWAFGEGQWSELAVGPGPGVRYAGAMASDGSGLVVFGGRAAPREWAVNDTWRLEQVGTNSRWHRVAQAGADQPTPRSSHVMSFDRSRRTVVMFGGQDSHGTSLNDTWEWSAATMRWAPRVASEPTSTMQPQQGLSPSFVFDEERGVSILVGGASRLAWSLVWVHAMWQWDGDRWTRMPDSVALPPDRTGGAIVYHAGRRCCLLHGGSSPSGFSLSDTWAWDGQSWSLLDTGLREGKRRRGRGGHAMVCLEATGEVLLFGGRDRVTDLGDTWIGRVVGR